MDHHTLPADQAPAGHRHAHARDAPARGHGAPGVLLARAGFMLARTAVRARRGRSTRG
jgi:hypothetical protein